MKPTVIAGALACLTSLTVVAEDACQMSLLSAQIDYGAATRAELQARSMAENRNASFGVRSVQLRIQCAVAQAMPLRFIAPMADATGYRWSAGSLQVRVVAARLDGARVQWRFDASEAVEGNWLRPGDRMVPWLSGAPAIGRHLDVELEVSASVNESSSRVADLTRYEGHGTFQLD
ncbi:hypothetical protein GIW70_02565 [Pseudomonas syringae]|nr:hypothetical protein [Pseudomonas syringae]MCF5067078.1 hypothetical protein [Pseudomonas syringae]